MPKPTKATPVLNKNFRFDISKSFNKFAMLFVCNFHTQQYILPQSCKRSNLLHGPISSNQILPQTFYPNWPISLHGYIRHIHDILQLCSSIASTCRDPLAPKFMKCAPERTKHRHYDHQPSWEKIQARSERSRSSNSSGWSSLLTASG